MTELIELTQGQHTIIDDEDLNLVKQFKWNAKKDKNNFYAKTNIKRPDTGRYTTLHLHRLLLKAKKGEQVDHINGNGLDNRRSNLRIVDARGNSQNLHIPKTSKYPGVYLNTQGEWTAQITVGNIGYQLGSYSSEKKAYEVYSEACKHADDLDKFKEFIIEFKFNQRANKVKGFYFSKREQKYMVQLNRKYIGRFDSPIKARDAYLVALEDNLIKQYG